MPTTLTNPRTMRGSGRDRARRVVPFMQRVRQDDSRSWRRLRADDRGISVESVLIGILLVAALATVAVFAIQWALNLGQTTVARANLEVAAEAVELSHAASLDGTHKSSRWERAVPELTWTAVGSYSDLEDLMDNDGSGDLAAGTVLYRIGVSGAGNDINIGTGVTPRVAANDVVWLFSRGENGDRYCAVVISQVIGTQTAVGVRYEGQAFNETFEAAATAAGHEDSCRAFPTTAHTSVAAVHADTERNLPDLDD